MVLLKDCVEAVTVGNIRFNTPSAKTIHKICCEADKRPFMPNVLRFPHVVNGRVADSLVRFSNDGKEIGHIERNAVGQVLNLTLYEYAQKGTVVKKTHSFGTPETTSTDILECTPQGEIIRSLTPDRSYECRQKLKDRYFGPSIPEYVNTEGNFWCKNPEIIPKQKQIIESVLNMFGLTENDLV